MVMKYETFKSPTYFRPFRTGKVSSIGSTIACGSRDLSSNPAGENQYEQIFRTNWTSIKPDLREDHGFVAVSKQL